MLFSGHPADPWNLSNRGGEGVYLLRKSTYKKNVQNLACKRPQKNAYQLILVNCAFWLDIDARSPSPQSLHSSYFRTLLRIEVQWLILSSVKMYLSDILAIGGGPTCHMLPDDDAEVLELFD